MSVYLGQEKVGVSYHRQGDYELTQEQFNELLKGAQYRMGDFDTRNIPQIVEDLKKEYKIATKVETNIGHTPSLPWVRPNGWPDLDSLNLQMEGNEDFIYATYDGHLDYGYIYVYCTGTNLTATLGHISNGAYVVDETLTKSGNYYFKDISNLNDYVVLRITGNITMCVHSSYTQNGRTQTALRTPLLERIAYIPHMTRLSSDSNSTWGTYFLQREKINNGTGDTLTSLNYAYYYCFSLIDLDITGLKTQNVTSMQNVFIYCYNLLTPLDLRHFDVKKVVSFNQMFSYCINVPLIDLRGWQTNALAGTGCLYNMFIECNSVKYIHGLSGFDISRCSGNSLYQTFSNCRNLRELEDLSNWDTSNCTNFQSLFNGCYSIKDLSFVSHWDTSNVTKLYSTFNRCYNIEKLDLSSWDVSKVTDVYSLFSDCWSLKQLDISGWTPGEVISIQYLFQNCFCLENINLDGWHITNKCASLYCTFSNCWSLKELNIPNDWDLTGTTATGNYVVANIFQNCYSLKRLTGIKNWHFNTAGAMGSCFASCRSLKELDVSGWDVSKATTLVSMFNGCYSLESLDLSNWNTSNVTSFANMFNYCQSLKTLNLSNFTTSNATTFADMFAFCNSLTDIGDISGWNTAKVTTLAEMFRDCYSLKTISNLSNWDVRKVTTITYLFNNCHSLKEITINNWNLAACTTMTYAFSYCYNLKTLTLNNWSFPKLTTAPGTAFAYCYSLQTFNGLTLSLNHSYSGDYSLSYTSIINILTNLPTVSSAKTITFSSIALNLITTAERQIATNKGWTISS